MPDRSWTLTVSYVNGVATITDPDGGKGDETIFTGETDEVTFQPGTGVRAVTALVINRPIPLPTGVTVTQTLSGSNCVVTDTDSLISSAQEVDVAYCISFTDSGGTARTTDPQLVNKPTQRPPPDLVPMARRAPVQPARSPVKPAAPARPAAPVKSSKPATPAAPLKPQAKPYVSRSQPDLGKSKPGKSR